jgi:hypothetical protein
VVRHPDSCSEASLGVREGVMPYDVQIHHVPQQAFAAVRCRANVHTIGDRIMALLSEVWDVLKNAEVRYTGHNVVLYWDEPGKASATWSHGSVHDMRSLMPGIEVGNCGGDRSHRPRMRRGDTRAGERE